MSALVVHPSQPLQGKISLPGDKSISHRAVIFGSAAEGVTRVENLLKAEDVLCTVEIFRKLGIRIRKKGKVWTVEGKGIGGLRQPIGLLYCGNSGTTLRLMTGLLSGYRFSSTLTGDASLNQRPMGRVIEPLRTMGAKIEETHDEKGRRFIRVSGGAVKGGAFRIPVASAQLKSALLLAGLSSGRKVSVNEPARSRDHSERMLKAFGADVRVRGLTATLYPVKRLRGLKITVPGDFSSAAFFLVAALINPDPKTCIVVRGVGLNETRTGALEVLRRMGGRLRIFNRKTVCGEPVGDIEAKPSVLHGVRILGKIIPRLIDEVPILAVAAAVARGRTAIRDAEELRIKETDRIRAIAAELPRFGVEVREFKDGLEIHGVGARSPRPGGGTPPLHGGSGQSHGDHRMAMSLAVLGTIARGTTTIDDTVCISTSFPGFVSLLKQIGGKLKSL